MLYNVMVLYGKMLREKRLKPYVLTEGDFVTTAKLGQTRIKLLLEKFPSSERSLETCRKQNNLG